MATKIGFWTPVKYENQPTTLGQKMRQGADSYFKFGGKVAVVIPGVIENGSTGVKLQEEQAVCWQTALKIASYFTVILPVLMCVVKVISRAFYPFHMCQRTLPNGTQESGTFVNGVLQQGVRIQGEQYTFLRPKLLLGEVKLAQEGIELNFAEVTINGRTEIIPVQKPYQEGVFDHNDQYVRYYAGSPNEALLKIAQDTTSRYVWSGNLHYGSPIKFVLQHANNYLLKTQEFLAHLLTPNQQGTLPLHTVNKSSLLEILELARDNNTPINLQTADPDTHETLFSKWAGTGDIKLTQELLAIAPSAIQQTAGREVSFFMKAILGGHMEEAQVLLQAMQEQQVELTPTDQWIQKAFTDDCNFTNEQFLQLPIELRCKVYQIANIYVQKKFLQKLRDFGMHQPPAAPEKASLFSYNMDAIDVENALRDFLGNLRRDGLLLTKGEFAQKDPARYCHKYDDVGRILGRDYIERTAKCLNLPHIKVPKKTAVIEPRDEDGPSLQFTVSRDSRMGLQCPELQIYAEKIELIDRKATRQEMMGLLDLIEATGFNDFFGQNLFMGKNQAGEEGIYFIDTEYKNFSCLPHYNGIRMLGKLMAAEDHPWLQEELNRRVALFEPRGPAMGEALQQEWTVQKPVFIEHGFADRRKPFTFAIADLVGQGVLQNAVNE
jgi:hypothetical protein